MILRTAAGIIIVFILAAPLCVSGQGSRSSRSDMTLFRRMDTFPIRADHTKEQKRRLSPGFADLEAYGEFLKKDRTGIFRLMPDLGCFDNANIVRADAACLNAIPESSFYSFREREHTIEPLADIRLENGFLVSDGLLSQGIMVVLREPGPAEVTAETAGIPFLRNYVPPVSNSEAQQHFLLYANGVSVGNYHYRKAVRAQVGSTYALRVVAYRGSAFRSFRGYRFDLLARDKRVDLLIVFRVVRRDEDGSVTIVWREIERRESPKLKVQNKR